MNKKLLSLILSAALILCQGSALAEDPGTDGETNTKTEISENLENADGASNLRILWQIILPLSMATVAVVTLYYAVTHWNSWFSAMLYLTDRNKFPLQLILREILINNDTTSMVTAMDAGAGDSSFVSETVKYAVIIVSVVPILCVYPFIQKYFTKGVMVGAVKG